MMDFYSIDFCIVLLLCVLIHGCSCQGDQRVHKKRILIGSSVILECSATENQNSKVFFQWIRKGFGYQANTMSSINGGPKRVLKTNEYTYSLEIQNAQKIDAGFYSCQIDQTIGDEPIYKLIKYFVEIIVPPTTLNFTLIQYKTDNIFIKRRHSTNEIWAVQGRRIKLNCVSIGSDVNPIPDLAWSNKNLFRKSPNEKNDTADVLMTPKLDRFNISCHVQNKKLYLRSKLPSLSVTLRVLYISPPIIKKTNSLNWNKINEGDLVSAECVAMVSSSADSVLYKWQLQLQDGEIKTIQNNTVSPSSRSSRLLLKVTRQHHQSRLLCIVIATVTKGLPCNHRDDDKCILSTSRTIKEITFFNVLYAPILAHSFESVTIDKLDTQIELKCEVKSNPPSTIRWYKTDVGTNKEARSIKWYHDTLLASLLETLRFINVVYTGPKYSLLVDRNSKLDIYICQIEYSDRHNIYKYILVAEKEKPSVRIGRKDLTVKQGDAASLMCLFESWPKLPQYDIVWTRHTSSKTIIMKKDKLRYHIKNRSQLMGVQSKLYFSGVQQEDYATYNCSIKYGSNTVSASINLKPPRTKVLSLYVPIVLIGALFLVVTVIVLVFCCCYKKIRYKNKDNKSGMYNNTLTHPLAPPLPLQQNSQNILYPSPTIDSCLEQEMFLSSRNNSLHGYAGQKEGSINIPQNRCFVFNTKQGMIRKFSCGEGVDDKVKIGNERSWDSGLCPDDSALNGLLYRNNGQNGSIHSGSTKNNNSTNSTNLNSSSIPPNQNSLRSHQPPYYILGNHTTSPFSTLASSSNNSINGRYWSPVVFNPGNQGNLANNILDHGSDTTLNNANPTIIGYHDNGSGMVPIAANNPLLLSNQIGDENGSLNGSNTQSYVCIPIEEYQNHLRMIRKGTGSNNPSLLDTNSITTKLSQNDMLVVNGDSNHGAELPSVMMSTFTNNNTNNNNNNNDSSTSNTTPNNITPTKIASTNK